jgi:putative transposase
MPTQKRQLVPGEIYHVYNRSVAKKTIFHTTTDYNRFILKMCEYKEKDPIEMLAYCLMPNHFHFLIRVDPKGRPRPLGSGKTANSSQCFLHRLLTSYSKYYCTRHADDHSGRLFQGPYKAKHVSDDAYYLKLCAYIHDNPVRKKLAEKPEDWPFSSYTSLIGIRKDDISSDAPELREMTHQEIYKEFSHNRNDSLDAIMQYI